jgi:DNA-binding IclR family transcriptional regulator
MGPSRVPARRSSDRPNRTVDSISRALRVIELLVREPSGALGVSEVAEHLGVGRSTAHQILTTLVLHNFAEQDRQSSRYGLGMAVLEAGAVALDRARLGVSLVPALEHLASLVGEVASIGVLSGTRALLVYRTRSDAVLRVDLRAGSLLPLHNTATGLVLLAWLEERQRGELIDQLALSEHDRDVLQHELALTLERGYAIQCDTSYPGISAIAAPVWGGRTGMVVGSLALNGPSVRFTPDKYRAVLLEAAARMSDPDVGHLAHSAAASDGVTRA